MHHQELYDKYLQGRHWEEHPTVYAESFADFLGEHGVHGSVVDLGCGTGRDVAVFAGRGLQVMGIDYSEPEITKAKALNPTCTFSMQNVEGLLLADCSVDAAYSINVMHYVDQKPAISEIQRVLRPDGYFFVHFNLKIVDKNGATDYEESEDEIMKLFEDWSIVDRQIFTRTDFKPTKHMHTILQLIVQKVS